MEENSPRFGILIIGFNRPDFLLERLKAVGESKWSNTEIFVSLDFPRKHHTTDKDAHLEILDQLEVVKSNLDFHLFVEKSNQGCDRHIPAAISKVLNRCDGVLVIEDDIMIPNEQIESILALANLNFREKKTEPIVTMSGISFGHLLRFNRWRKTPYFTAWGYFLFKDFWNCHKLFMDSLDLAGTDFFHHSQYWNKLSQRKKMLWEERFSRKNYDYLIQKSIFALDLRVYAPVFRIANNLGFGNLGAVHTRFSTPYFLRHNVKSFSKVSNLDCIKSNMIQNFFVCVDSNTWAGDGWLSKRGRTMGIRTFVKRTFTNTRRIRVD